MDGASAVLREGQGRLFHFLSATGFGYHLQQVWVFLWELLFLRCWVRDDQRRPRVRVTRLAGFHAEKPLRGRQSFDTRWAVRTAHKIMNALVPVRRCYLCIGFHSQSIWRYSTDLCTKVWTALPKYCCMVLPGTPLFVSSPAGAISQTQVGL